jgi:hypothetical protein
MNIKEELTKYKLLSNYLPNKTIKENIESMTIKDGEVEENILPGLARSSGKKFIPVFDDIIKFATARGKQPIMVLDSAAQGGKRVVTDGADLLKMIKAGSIDATNLARVNIGMFKASGVVDDTLKALASDIVKQKDFIKNYSQLAKSPAKLKAALRQKGYSEAGADALIAEIKGTKGFATKAKTATNTTTKTVKTASGKTLSLKPTIGAVGTLTRNAANALINGVRKLKWNWPRILKWGVGLGLGAAALWWACWKLGLVPEGMPEVQPKTDGNTGGSGNTGGGNTGGGTSTKYTPCPSFPMVYGCKSDEIREVQSCLGFEQKYQTGNFGPITMKGLGGLKELTKEKYDEIIAKCKGTTVAPSPEMANAPEVVTTAPEVGTSTSDTSTLPTITPPPVPTEPVMDNNRLQELLSSNHLKLRKNLRGQMVLRWSGPKLSGPDYYILSKSLEGKGYKQVTQRETGDKSDDDITMKYKWKKSSK